MRSFTKNVSVALLLAAAMPATAQWTKIATMPGGPVDGCAAFVIGDTAYVSGGVQGASLHKYHAASDKWVTQGNIGGNTNRGFAFGFGVKGKGYIMGGFASGGVRDDIWMYDPLTGQWTKKADFPGGPRNAGFCFVIGDTAYVGAGEEGNNGRWDDFWKYEPVADKWTLIGYLPMGPLMFPASFVLNGKGYVATGEFVVGTGVGEKSLMWEFDPATATWTQKADFPGTARQSAIGFTADNLGYIGGGQSGYNKTYTDIWMYDARSDKWAKAPDMPMSTPAWSTTFVLNGTTYIGTGVSFASAGLNGTSDFYRYNPTLSVKALPAKAPIAVYPNPADRFIYVDVATGKPATIMVNDIAGRTVLKYTNTTVRRFDISSLESGVYILSVSDKETRTLQRFIKR